MSEVLKVSGGRVLSGTIRVGGSKNASLPILASTLAINGKIRLSNIPNITDCHFMNSMLKHLGCQVHWVNKNEVEIKSDCTNRSDLLVPYVSEVRASSLFLAGLLARHGEASIGMPGGDRIGERPLNFHISALESFGYRALTKQDYLFVKKRKKTPRTISIKLPYPSVGATQQIIILASCQNTEVTIFGAAVEPEVQELCRFLCNCGAKIFFNQARREIFIRGNKHLQANDVFTISGDRIEFITYMILGILKANALRVEGVELGVVKNAIKFLKRIGAEISESGLEAVKVQRSKKLKPFNLVAKPYPGFPTDGQPLMAILATASTGTCSIRDTVFPSRFRHMNALAQFGLKYKPNKNGVSIPGGQKLQGAKAVIQDIRSGAALVIAGICAEGESELHQYHHIRRGYEDFDIKLREIGADVFTVEDLVESV